MSDKFPNITISSVYEHINPLQAMTTIRVHANLLIAEYEHTLKGYEHDVELLEQAHAHATHFMEKFGITPDSLTTSIKDLKDRYNTLSKPYIDMKSSIKRVDEIQREIAKTGKISMSDRVFVLDLYYQMCVVQAQRKWLDNLKMSEYDIDARVPVHTTLSPRQKTKEIELANYQTQVERNIVSALKIIVNSLYESEDTEFNLLLDSYELTINDVEHYLGKCAKALDRKATHVDE